MTSCNSLLDGNISRDIELVLQTPANLTEAVIQNSSGNIKIKSVKTTFVVTSVTNASTSTSVVTSGSASDTSTANTTTGLSSNDYGVSMNGKRIAVFNSAGNLLPTEHSVQWDSKVEIPSINLASSGGQESLTATINAFQLEGSANNKKIFDTYNIVLKDLQIGIKHPYPSDTKTSF